MKRIHERYITEHLDREGHVCGIDYTVPEDFNFAYDVVDAWAAEQPDKLALLWTDIEGREERFTFADVKRESERCAAMLWAHGIRRGDIVMLILKRHYEYWFFAVALHRIGAVMIPATAQLAAKDVVYRVDSADVKALVVTAADGVIDRVNEALGQCKNRPLSFTVRGARDGFISYEDEITKYDGFPRPTGDDATRADDMLLMYFTSGTTGMPKMVAHRFDYPIAHIITAKYWQNVSEDGLHLTIAETGWAKASWGKIYGQWFMGTALFVHDFDRFDPPQMLSVISKYKITTFCAPPTMYRFFIKEDLSAYDLSSLRHCATAGEALNPEVYEQWLAATGVRIMDGFGQSEGTPLAFNPYWTTPRPGSMGPASFAYDVDVVDEDGKSVDAGVVGEIVVRTEQRQVGLFVGYYRDDERTNELWHDGLYHTGDTAWRDEDGYLWYVGRTDDLIKCSGYRIGPFEIESVLMEHPDVLECAVVGAPDPVRGQVVKAVIVLRKGAEPSDALTKELQAYVKKQTAFYKYPRIIEYRTELPKTVSGKIRRTELRSK